MGGWVQARAYRACGKAWNEGRAAQAGAGARGCVCALRRLGGVFDREFCPRLVYAVPHNIFAHHDTQLVDLFVPV